MQDLRHALSSALLIAGVALVSIAPRAHAQVTLSLTTTEQSSCVAVTDAQGLRLAPGGTDLQATGVTLTGDGCGSANSEFDATVSAPGTAVAGTPFNITWSASSDATRCTYGGTAGVTNWPVGQEACAGAACAGAHSPLVTIPNAGNYTFSVTCTNATGYAQDGLTATAPAQAPQPPNFALNAPTTATLGTPISVTWSVTGAASCMTPLSRRFRRRASAAHSSAPTSSARKCRSAACRSPRPRRCSHKWGQTPLKLIRCARLEP